MNVFAGSFALIRSQFAQPCRWLFLNQLEHLSLIEAAREDGATCREVIEAEVSHQLKLRRGRDYLVSSYSRRHFSDTLFLPRSGETVWFEVDFFVVDLFTADAKTSVNDNPDCCWLTSKEVHNGRDRVGTPIVETQSLLLKATDVIPAWWR